MQTKTIETASLSQVTPEPDTYVNIVGAHSGDFLRLLRLLKHNSGNQFVFIAFTSFAYRDQIIERLNAIYPHSARLEIADTTLPSELIHQLAELGRKHGPIHLTGLEPWLRKQTNAAGLGALNQRREYLAETIPTTLVFWLEQPTIAAFANQAADLWAWRTAVLDFSEVAPRRERIDQKQLFLGNAELVALENRLSDIQSHIKQRSPLSAADAALMLEASRIEMRRGNLDNALNYAESAKNLFNNHDHIREKAIASGQIADVFQARGQLDEALRIRQEEQLPVYEKLGDIRERAITLGKIADVFQARGQTNEALRILQEELLPVFEKLGDVRSRAVTLGQIADVFHAHGQLDEALRIRQEEQLPVFEQLGDISSRAVTLGKIADVFQARGQTNEALRILQEELLPVFEKLGDVRSRAVTLGRIADVFQARGQLDEALALQEERMPIAEKMQDVDSIAHIRYSRARIRLQRGDHERGGLQEINEDLAFAFDICRKLEQPDGIGAVGRLLAQVLSMRGLRTEALGVLDVAESAWRKLGHAQ
ncbi:MAG: tetratricopeptide repeat protein [Halothiobacillaceae bacterium]|nr:tetratricopeptide repeat protein [Halothiobacillaceae bacterium]